MLTADLVSASVRSGKVRPRYVDVSDAGLRADAEALRGLVQAHIGRPMGELQDAIADHIGDSTDFLVRRGLIKLLMDGSTVEVKAPRPPTELREVVFEEAARAWPVGPAGMPGVTSREEVLARAAERLGLDAAVIDASLYGDLKSEQVLTDAADKDVDALLERYNLALAQAVLLRAREVVVTLNDPKPARARQLFRIVKFHQLMHRAQKTKAGWTLTLDGPLSLFKQTQRYGLQLALFLPSLCHCPSWSLEAEVAWGPQRLPAKFEVDHSYGLKTHTRERGTWESEEERHLRRTFKKLDGPWRLRRSTRIVDLDGRGVLVPDFLLQHEDGRTALLEIVWFWRKQSFKRRLALLQEAGPPNLIVALATRLHAGEGGLPELPGRVYPFKGVIVPKRLLQLAEEVAT